MPPIRRTLFDSPPSRRPQRRYSDDGPLPIFSLNPKVPGIDQSQQESTPTRRLFTESVRERLSGPRTKENIFDNVLHHRQDKDKSTVLQRRRSTQVTQLSEPESGRNVAARSATVISIDAADKLVLPSSEIIPPTEEAALTATISYKDTGVQAMEQQSSQTIVEKQQQTGGKTYPPRRKTNQPLDVLLGGKAKTGVAAGGKQTNKMSGKSIKAPMQQPAESHSDTDDLSEPPTRTGGKLANCLPDPEAARDRGQKNVRNGWERDWRRRKKLAALQPGGKPIPKRKTGPVTSSVPKKRSQPSSSIKLLDGLSKEICLPGRKRPARTSASRSRNATQEQQPDASDITSSSSVESSCSDAEYTPVRKGNGKGKHSSYLALPKRTNSESNSSEEGYEPAYYSQGAGKRVAHHPVNYSSEEDEPPRRLQGKGKQAAYPSPQVSVDPTQPQKHHQSKQLPNQRKQFQAEVQQTQQAQIGGKYLTALHIDSSDDEVQLPRRTQGGGKVPSDLHFESSDHDVDEDEQLPRRPQSTGKRLASLPNPEDARIRAKKDRRNFDDRAKRRRDREAQKAGLIVQKPHHRIAKKAPAKEPVRWIAYATTKYEDPNYFDDDVIVCQLSEYLRAKLGPNLPAHWLRLKFQNQSTHGPKALSRSSFCTSRGINGTLPTESKIAAKQSQRREKERMPALSTGQNVIQPWVLGKMKTAREEEEMQTELMEIRSRAKPVHYYVPEDSNKPPVRITTPPSVKSDLQSETAKKELPALKGGKVKAASQASVEALNKWRQKESKDLNGKDNDQKEVGITATSSIQAADPPVESNHADAFQALHNRDPFLTCDPLELEAARKDSILYGLPQRAPSSSSAEISFNILDPFTGERNAGELEDEDIDFHSPFPLFSEKWNELPSSGLSDAGLEVEDLYFPPRSSPPPGLQALQALPVEEEKDGAETSEKKEDQIDAPDFAEKEGQELPCSYIGPPFVMAYDNELLDQLEQQMSLEVELNTSRIISTREERAASEPVMRSSVQSSRPGFGTRAASNPPLTCSLQEDQQAFPCQNTPEAKGAEHGQSLSGLIEFLRLKTSSSSSESSSQSQTVLEASCPLMQSLKEIPHVGVPSDGPIKGSITKTVCETEALSPLVGSGSETCGSLDAVPQTKITFHEEPTPFKDPSGSSIDCEEHEHVDTSSAMSEGFMNFEQAVSPSLQGTVSAATKAAPVKEPKPLSAAEALPALDTTNLRLLADAALSACDSFSGFEDASIISATTISNELPSSSTLLPDHSVSFAQLAFERMPTFSPSTIRASSPPFPPSQPLHESVASRILEWPTASSTRTSTACQSDSTVEDMRPLSLGRTKPPSMEEMEGLQCSLVQTGECIDGFSQDYTSMVALTRAASTAATHKQ
ncbi:hypothetical protein BJ508DRAFT_331036 [Ascobolus immersus RN42]|uniref:Uncharacterized protein n=1 Tax=Ascobolus immersus RN42 TaxID=1160509 RepID=A0A3N4HT65_ASCIM|nr:hypothetical protein BJ508DRAFT_331036 [Ascobolus immersus RN42]